LWYFILSSFICQDTSFTLTPPQFSCCHLLATGIKVSKQYWYWVWQPIKVLPNTQYHTILENIEQYPIPQYQYRSNPIFHNSYQRLLTGSNSAKIGHVHYYHYHWKIKEWDKLLLPQAWTTIQPVTYPQTSRRIIFIILRRCSGACNITIHKTITVPATPQIGVQNQTAELPSLHTVWSNICSRAYERAWSRDCRLYAMEETLCICTSLISCVSGLRTNSASYSEHSAVKEMKNISLSSMAIKRCSNATTGGSGVSPCCTMVQCLLILATSNTH